MSANWSAIVLLGERVDEQDGERGPERPQRDQVAVIVGAGVEGGVAPVKATRGCRPMKRTDAATSNAASKARASLD